MEGVPEENHFAVLGLKTGASEDDIKSAYRSLAKSFHPDKNSDPRAEEKFKRVKASYEFLSSKDRRETHERELINMNKRDRNKRSDNYRTKPEMQKQERPRERDHRRERNWREERVTGGGYGSPFGEFRSYEEEFNAFFSERDPFRKRDPNEIMNEFMGRGRVGGFNFLFGDIERLMSDFTPFRLSDRRHGDKSETDRGDRAKRQKKIQFKVPGSEWTSFDNERDKNEAFRDLRQ